MRLFVALSPPERVLDEVDAAIEPYRGLWPGLRWTRRETWHVTLAFYGEVEEAVLPRLLPRLERAAARYPSQELTFAGVGAFPRAAAGRVFWTGIPADLSALADSCAAAARRAGVRSDERTRFHAHLTLARARSGPLDLRPLIAELQAYAGSPWAADRIELIRSHLGRDVRYETLHTWPLAG